MGKDVVIEKFPSLQSVIDKYGSLGTLTVEMRTAREVKSLLNTLRRANVQYYYQDYLITQETQTSGKYSVLHIISHAVLTRMKYETVVFVIQQRSTTAVEKQELSRVELCLRIALAANYDGNLTEECLNRIIQSLKTSCSANNLFPVCREYLDDFKNLYLGKPTDQWLSVMLYLEDKYSFNGEPYHKEKNLISQEYMQVDEILNKLVSLLKVQLVTITPSILNKAISTFKESLPDSELIDDALNLFKLNFFSLRNDIDRSLLLTGIDFGKNFYTRKLDGMPSNNRILKYLEQEITDTYIKAKIFEAPGITYDTSDILCMGGLYSFKTIKKKKFQNLSSLADGWIGAAIFIRDIEGSILIPAKDNIRGIKKGKFQEIYFTVSSEDYKVLTKTWDKALSVRELPYVGISNFTVSNESLLME